MLKKLFMFILILGIASSAFAMPSERDSRLVWSHDGDSDLAGFWVYAAPEKESPRVYSDARRFRVPLATAREAIVLDLSSDISKSWCFRVTAYDTSDNESEFSNEACGWFGFTPPNTISVE